MTKTHCGAADKKEYHKDHTCITCWHHDRLNGLSNGCGLCFNLGCFWHPKEEIK